MLLIYQQLKPFYKNKMRWYEISGTTSNNYWNHVDIVKKYNTNYQGRMTLCCFGKNSKERKKKRTIEKQTINVDSILLIFARR